MITPHARRQDLISLIEVMFLFMKEAANGLKAGLHCSTKQIYLPPGISRSAQTADQISGKP